MDEERDSIHPLKVPKQLFNKEEASDVRFIVEGQTVYGHKWYLALFSPVFKRMFFGDQRDEREEIEFEDLTLTGFKNALR